MLGSCTSKRLKRGLGDDLHAVCDFLSIFFPLGSRNSSLFRRLSSSSIDGRAATSPKCRVREVDDDRPLLAHSFRSGTGRYDPFAKPSMNGRYFSVADSPLRRPRTAEFPARCRNQTETLPPALSRKRTGLGIVSAARPEAEDAVGKG